jgi:DNA-binding PadR family transcriptional regulator
LRPELRPESPLAAKIVQSLVGQESGKAQLARLLGHKTVSGELKKQIRKLLDLGLIEMTIPDKPNSPLQKYRLTRQGKELFQQREDEET